MQEAIKLAIEGGYKYWHDDLTVEGILKNWNKENILLDSEFWQSLGKALGWKEKYCTSGCGCKYPNGDGSHEKECVWRGKNEWEERWNDFIHVLIEGGNADSFFKELISNHNKDK